MSQYHFTHSSNKVPPSGKIRRRKQTQTAQLCPKTRFYHEIEIDRTVVLDVAGDTSSQRVPRELSKRRRTPRDSTARSLLRPSNPSPPGSSTRRVAIEAASATGSSQHSIHQRRNAYQESYHQRMSLS